MSSELGVERPTTLTLPEPQEERRVHFGDVSSACLVNDEQTSTTPCSRDPEFRPKRIRSASFSAPGECRYGNKRRKRHSVLPSKFLLGGNINDPLNLGSLDREEASQLGLVETSAGVITKKSDAVRVIIPPNINDPLNLDVSSENEDSLNDALQRQLRKRRRNRKRKRRLSEPSGDVDVESLQLEKLEECQIPKSNNGLAPQQQQPKAIVPPELPPKISPETLKPLSVNTEYSAPTLPVVVEEQKDSSGQVTSTAAKPSTSGFQRPSFKKQRSKSDNKIVSPVIPQPGVERKRHSSHSRLHLEKPHLSQQNLKLPKKFNPKNEHFQYGNYNKYYGYRNPDMTPDIRLRYLKPEWFEGKEVLDIGCNIGHITLTVARDYNPKRVVGLDIDKKLVNIAQKNIKHYLQKGDVQETNFPKSMRLLYGPLKPPVTADGARRFPYNIKFVHANYVLESDELLETVRPEFDVIMCLSITKWIHLNWGDPGLKRFFRRIFYNLKPGGRFILEPQGWPSYNKRRKLTMRIFENYKNIRLFPDKFNDYLLHKVGFSTSEKMITPQHSSRGFQRPIIIYTKAGGTTKPSSFEECFSRDPSTMRENTSKRSHSPEVSGLCRVVSKEDARISQEVTVQDTRISQEVTVPEKRLKTEDGGKTNGANCASNENEKVVLDHAQGASSKNNKLTVKTLDCVLDSQSSSSVKMETLEKGQELASKSEGSDAFVCDIVNIKKSSDEEGDRCLTHSLNHKQKSCVVVVVESSCSTQNSSSSSSSNVKASENSEGSECYAKPTKVHQTLITPVKKSENDFKGVCQEENIRSIGSSGIKRTSLESTDSKSLSETTNQSVCGTLETTACEKSKKENKVDDANK